MVEDNYNEAADTSEEIEQLLDDIPYAALRAADNELLTQAVNALHQARAALRELLTRHQ